MNQAKSEKIALVGDTQINQSCYGSLGPESRLICFSICLGIGKHRQRFEFMMIRDYLTTLFRLESFTILT